MTDNAESFRRWLGMLFLTTSFAMAIWGQIVLQPHLSGVAFTLYWSACLGLGLGAAGIGILDVRAVLRNLKAERRALLRRAMRDIRPSKNESAEPQVGKQRPLPPRPWPGSRW